MRYARFYRYILPVWKIEACILLLGWIIMVFGLIAPYLTKLVIDKAYGNRDLSLFIKLAAAGGGLFILNSAAGSLSVYLTRYARLRVNCILKLGLFKKIQALPYRFFQDTSSGNNLYKINSDSEQVIQFISDTLPHAISTIPRLVIILVIIFGLDWRMTAIALALTPLLYIAPLFFKRRLVQFHRITVKKSQGIFKMADDTLLHMRLIKLFGSGPSEAKRYASRLIENFRFNLAKARLDTASNHVNSVAARAVFGLAAFYGGYQVTKGRMTLGTLTAITLYLNQLAGMHAAIIKCFQQALFFHVSCGRLSVILDEPAGSLERPGAKNIIFLKGEVRFEDVTFGYKPRAAVLKNLTFAVPGGAHIALVGPSGCGKTTVASLIARLYGPDSGRVCVDGGDIRDIKSKFFYAQVGIAMQGSNLWNNTAGNNIKYGKPDAGPDEIREAAKAACIDSFIETLPQGYDTVIGENACRISAGQKQRIAIARALVKKPKILILDEAMSSLDSETEDRIIGNIRKEFRDSTIIVVSHRLSTARKMDLVYFLRDPRAMEAGTHEELMGSDPGYRALFASQISGPQAEGFARAGSAVIA